VITIFNLILDFTVMLGDTTWSDVSLHFLINAFILNLHHAPRGEGGF